MAKEIVNVTAGLKQSGGYDAHSHYKKLATEASSAGRHDDAKRLLRMAKEERVKQRAKKPKKNKSPLMGFGASGKSFTIKSY